MHHVKKYGDVYDDFIRSYHILHSSGPVCAAQSVCLTNESGTVVTKTVPPVLANHSNLHPILIQPQNPLHLHHSWRPIMALSKSNAPCAPLPTSSSHSLLLLLPLLHPAFLNCFHRLLLCWQCAINSTSTTPSTAVATPSIATKTIHPQLELSSVDCAPIGGT